MKTKLLAICLAVMSTYASAQTAASFQTTEYYKSRVLDPIKASSAYARGYTGAGSTIAILDTGIDINSAEFKDKIVLSKDFSGSGTVQDTLGHGTHVAGIAAAANNGMGVEGVAYGANLMVGKISAGSLIFTTNTLAALDWAGTNGATVANISSGSALSTNIKPVLVAPGVYITTTTTESLKITNRTTPYTGTSDPAQWAAAMKNDIVVVFAAGNDGTAYPMSSGLMAVATDSKGNLVLGGRAIIAGNWNSQSNQLGYDNNGAATLCVTYTAGVCKDKYKVSDFYLMAPGMGISSTVPTSVNKSGYINMSGTSMAAPAISGGVAIIHQMWPQMTGANIVQLLLKTGNKNLPGYNVNVMGQGLMDLDRATQPVGAVGIPTTGRAGNVKAVAPILVTGGTAGTGKLNSFMVMDSFERDFYADSNQLTAVRRAAPMNVNQAALSYTSKNAYSQIIENANRSHAAMGNVEVSVYSNETQNQKPSMIEFAYNKQSSIADVKFTAGMLTETNTWLGNSVSNITAAENRSVTYLTGVGTGKNFQSGTAIYANVMHGITRTGDHSSDVKAVGVVKSYSWNVGIEQTLAARHTVGVMVYQPVSVYSAQAQVDIPVGLDNQYNVVTADSMNLAATVKEKRTGVYYKFSETATTSVLTFVENRTNYQGQAGVSNNIAGITVARQF